MIPLRLLAQSCSILINSPVQDTKSGQQKDNWAVAYSNIPCRLDLNKATRYVSQEVDAVKSTHTLYANYPLPVVPNPKDHHISVDGKEFRIINVTPVYLLQSTPSHYEIDSLEVD